MKIGHYTLSCSKNWAFRNAWLQGLQSQKKGGGVFAFHKMRRIFWLVENRLASQEGLLHTVIIRVARKYV